MKTEISVGGKIPPYDKDRIEMAHRAFDFLIIATPEEIEEIGWRLGEKLDGSDADDLISRYLAPLLAGLEKGSLQNDHRKSSLLRG